MGFVRVFQPADVTQAAEARLALQGSRIPFFIQNENYLHTTGLPFSIGAAQIFVLVPEEHVDDAREVLADWFERESPPAPPAAPRAGSKGAVRAVAAPFLFILGLFGLAELAIALGRKLSNEQSAEEATPD